jgi:DNA-binding NarL/FixJ family response regulator
MHDSLCPPSVFAVFLEGKELGQTEMENCGVILSIPAMFEAPTSMARILIADDYDAARRAIRRLVEGRPGWEVCGEAADGLGVVLKTAELKPDLVIIDLALGMIDGLTAAREISAAMPRLPIVLCTVFATDVLERQSHEFGIRAVVDKSDAGTQLVSVVEGLLNSKV